jgi:hypothetical protein
MAEIKTPPVTARLIADKEEFFRDRVAGSFRIGPADTDGELSFWYCCPCGCRAVAPLIAGNKFKPADGPSWEWDGSTEAPTLTPSVWHKGHWHGHLKAGVWESC